MRLEPNATSPNLIGGFSANSVTTGVVGATISGGGQSGSTNRVTDDFGTIGGGRANQAGDNAGTTFNRSFATVGGGRNNTASGLLATVGGGSINAASGQLATVGGGQSNTATGRFSTVPGGLSNAAAGDYSFGGGGRDNIATGNYATIPGGDCNTAGGAYCFAAGRDCNASHLGSFVWADHNTTDLTTTGIDQFLVQASGGVKIFSDPNVTVGVQLFPSGNSWSSISDRALKENLTRVDPGEVLQKLARVPVTQWNLKSQDPSIQHIGPMAQDFHAVFGVGESDRHISSSDADGVALAAIQGLYEMVKEKDAEIAALRAEMDDRIAALEKKLTELTATEER